MAEHKQTAHRSTDQPATPLHTLPATRQVELVQSGELKFSDLLQHYIDRQKTLKPSLHAFSILEHERAAQDAAQFSQQAKSPFFGLITADKDLDSRKGSPNFRGSLTTSEEGQAADDRVTEALNAAQIVSTGRTQVPEFGLTGTAVNARFPWCNNPWNTNFGPGGSSSGAAAAVAAGLLPVAVASDAGGSARIPAASCAVIGFKPSRRFLPYDGLHDANKDSVHGTITRNVSDAALLFDAMLHQENHDQLFLMKWKQETPRELKILATTYSPWDETLNINLPKSFLKSFQDTISALQNLGHTVVKKDLGEFSGYPESFIRLWQKGASTIPLNASQEEQVLPFTSWLRTEGKKLSTETIAQDLQFMEDFEAWFDEATAEFDVILTPALGLAAQTHEWHDEGDPVRNFEKQCEYSPYSSYLNKVGNPAITLPVALGSEETAGIPISIQLVGKKGTDVQLLALAHQLEQHLQLSIPYPLD